MLNPTTGRISETRDVMWLNIYKWGGDSDETDPPETWEIDENETEKSANFKIEENVGENAPIDNGEPPVDDGDEKNSQCVAEIGHMVQPRPQ